MAAFFFLLRVGEYTPSTRETRTVPLRRQDVRFFRNCTLIPHDAGYEALAAATSVTICFENQKNGYKGCMVKHHPSGKAPFCPVKSLAALISQIADLPSSTPLGTFRTTSGGLSRVSADDIRAAISFAAQETNVEASGFDLARIGSHSLRASGATHLALCGYNDSTIQKIGRWSTNTFVLYIREQIANLTAGVAANMARTTQFHNVT